MIPSAVRACKVCGGRADFFPESGAVCVVHVAVEDAAPVRSDLRAAAHFRCAEHGDHANVCGCTDVVMVVDDITRVLVDSGLQRMAPTRLIAVEIPSQAAPARVGRNERRVWRVRLAAALMAKVEAERAIGRAAEEREAIRESLATTRDALVLEIAASSKLEHAATRALAAMRGTESQGKAWPPTSGFAMAMRALAAALGKEAE